MITPRQFLGFAGRGIGGVKLNLIGAGRNVGCPYLPSEGSRLSVSEGQSVGTGPFVTLFSALIRCFAEIVGFIKSRRKRIFSTLVDG